MNKVSRNVFIAAGVSIIWLSLYKLIFVRMSPIFPHASQVSDIVFGIATSIVASGIFYYYNVYKKEQHEAKFIHPIINDALLRFNLNFSLMMNAIYEEKELTWKWGGSMDSKERFKEICTNIDLSKKPRKILGIPDFDPQNWYQYFDYFFFRNDQLSTFLYKHSGYLTPEIFSLLNQLEFNSVKAMLKDYKTNGYYNYLDGLSNPLWDYLDALRIVSTLRFKVKDPS